MDSKRLPPIGTGEELGALDACELQMTSEASGSMPCEPTGEYLIVVLSSGLLPPCEERGGYARRQRPRAGLVRFIDVESHYPAV
jgi:hypothetical protein